MQRHRAIPATMSFTLSAKPRTKKKYRKRERKHLKIGNPVGSHSSTVPFKMNRNVYLEKQETVHSASPDRPERVDRP